MPLTDDHPPMGSSISGMLFLAPGDSTTLPTAPRQQRGRHGDRPEPGFASRDGLVVGNFLLKTGETA
jgi:hypothetical protein